MAYWRHFFHIVWVTQDRLPLIRATIESEMYTYITNKALSLGCIPHAIGGIADHLHLAISIPPRIAVADLVGKLKGSSSHHANYHFSDNPAPFAWKGGYGSFSFGETQLPKAVDYVLNQKIHHQHRTTIALLERIEDEDNGPIPSEKVTYEQQKPSGFVVKDADALYGHEWPF